MSEANRPAESKDPYPSQKARRNSADENGNYHDGWGRVGVRPLWLTLLAPASDPDTLTTRSGHSHSMPYLCSLTSALCRAPR
jgi:hypothetical protein